jgi:tetratricopeptide (TPR) repeat protein
MGLLDAALAQYQRVESATADAEILAEVLLRKSSVFRSRCQWPEALDAAQRSGQLADAAGRTAQLVEALNAEASVHMSRGDFDRALPLLHRMLELARDPRLRGIAVGNLGAIAAQRGDFGAAEEHFAESVECLRAAGYRRGEALALNNYGRATLDRGDHLLAAELLRRTVELARQVNDADLAALAMLNYGEALLRQGEVERAEEMASTALGFYTSSGDSWRRIESLRLLGDIHARRDDVRTTVACYDQALALARDIGARVEIEQLEQRVAAVTAARPAPEGGEPATE